MTSLFKKRWLIFKNKKRSFYALILFLGLFVLSMLSPIIANDKPLFVWYKGAAYFPITSDYTDAFFGGSLPTFADYKDTFTRDEIAKNGFMIMPPIAFSYDTINYDLTEAAPSQPSNQNWLGTDDQGRDVLARLLYGIRISILFGLILTLISSFVGIMVGALQGYFGGKTDLFIGRFLEIWGSLPQMFILIIISSILLPDFWTLLIILLLFSWTGLVGVVRAEFLRARNFDYVRAARALGVSDARIMLRHILPNALVASVTYIPFILSAGIVALTALDFLGFGLPAGSPSMGELVRQGKENLNAPWLGLSAFVSMALLLVCLVFVGEGVRAAFDPREKQASESRVHSQKQPCSAMLLSVRNLNVAFGKKSVVRGASFDIPKGKNVAVVGESGSGKSITALSILGLVSGASIRGSIQLDGQELLGLSERELCAIRGRKIGLIFQEPMTSLNPLHRIQKQIAEVIKIHFGKVSQNRIYDLLEMVEITQDKKRILNSFPHQLSGGQRQRVMIAMALAGEPELLIADEPTTALDVTLQRQVLDVLKKLQSDLGLSILFISHDKAVVSYMTDMIYEMENGRLKRFMPKPVEAKNQRRRRGESKSVLSARQLAVTYGQTKALLPIDLTLSRGKTLAIIGESGSGKTSLANGLLQLIPAAGKILIDSTNFRKDVQVVFQDPFSSLNPRMTVEQIVAEGLKVHFIMTSAQRHCQVRKILKMVDLAPDILSRYPHELSGGQRQRIAIARALILNPKVLVLDEPTSALDEKNRTLILKLLDKIQAQTGIAYLLITHDMNVVRQMADEVLVLKAGMCIEQGSALAVLTAPKNEYTKNLIAAVL